MRLSDSASIPSSSTNNGSPSSSSKARKKHKRLDAICEQVYTRNRGSVEKESNDGSGNGVTGGADTEIRRSSRVRRAPVMLDFSPSPVKKRRKIDKNEGRLSGKRDKGNVNEAKSFSSPKWEDSGDDEEEDGGWKSRLRSRARIARKQNSKSPRGKRKLFEEVDAVKEEETKSENREVSSGEEGSEVMMSTAIKSKAHGRIKDSNFSINGEKENESNILKDVENDLNEMEVLGNDYEEDLMDVNGGIDYNASEFVEKMECENADCAQLEEECNDSGKDDTVEKIDEFQEQPEPLKEGENHQDDVDIGGIKTNNSEGEMIGDKPLNENKESRYLDHKVHRPRIKEGRRCGLCGCVADGKPPKRLVYAMAESENDECSGSTASEEPNYDIWDGFGEEPGWLGSLLGPINDRFGIAGTWVHQHCAVWSPEVYFADLGCLKNVRAALCRGRALKCSRCGRRGATIGCRVDRCPKTYHLPCARADNCIFDHRKFLIACTDHRHLFQPLGNQYLHRIKKMKAMKMKLEIRKMSNDAWKKDIEAEEKWLEGEDEEFLKREKKRLQRDILRIAPVYIGGPNSENQQSYQGWESVAGLQNVIQCMKEVVILPLLYPEFFSNLGLTPPRGVLLHGYPGTGKTLVVRSLIGACARGDKRIAYFARKGADCLGKYVGDAERQLRLLFQVAEKSQPSIIFFDEIDGLAPRRNRQQDQTHSSVVSTLLALMDGLKSRGSVVVIGATNRPDAIDPALRRPGRFDREIYFPLPPVKDRAAILSLHTQKWPKPVSGTFLNWVARKTVGFAGADLQALCTQAAIIALKRNCPLQELLSNAAEKGSNGNRSPLPVFAVEERDWLEALFRAPPPCSHREAGMAANDVASSPLPAHLVSCLLLPLTTLLVSLYVDERLSLPSPLSKAATMIKNVIVTTLDKKRLPSDCWWVHVKDLLQETDVAKEIGSEFLRAGILIRDDITFDDDGDGIENFESFKMHGGYRSSLLRNTSYASGKNCGLRILIGGGPRHGQSHLASCLLHCFVGNVKIVKVDLATILQEGHGDVLHGLTQILMKCSSLASCVIFMPRIDLWAVVKTQHQVDIEESDSDSTNEQSNEKESGTGRDQVLEMTDESCLSSCNIMDISKHKYNVINADEVSACNLGENSIPDADDDIIIASLAWSTFMEQVDSICVSTSVMILATSEVPFQKLPLRIRKFFNKDISDCTNSTSEYTVPRISIQADGNFNHDAMIVSSSTKLSRDLVQHFVQLIHHNTHITSTKPCGEYKTCNTFEKDPDQSTNQQKADSKPVPLPQITRQLKGKSSLVVAISTLGSQILGYPHFAELCWVTSKLKDGPFSDINGPWKGWPFNTCIIRPSNSMEHMQSKGKTSVVRGLVAVGLLAYKGVYTSIGEVSLEIRKVLKLLVENINSKIEAGKNKNQFVRLLSQVAYLDDVVNSWAYTLQSLEHDASSTQGNAPHTTLQSPDHHNVCADKQHCNDESELGIANRSSNDLELLEESNNNCPGSSNPNEKVAMPQEDDQSDPNTHPPNSSTVDELDDKVSNTANDVSEKTEKPLQQNGVALTESVSITCLYSCCTECVHELHILMRKVLKHEWEVNGICKTVEDVHDIVASLSMKLLMDLRKDYISENKIPGRFEIHDIDMCRCENTEFKAVNCTCHSLIEKVNTSLISQLGFDSKFMYRDGVLAAVHDLENDVSSHCRFETLCLCPLIKWISMTKKPSD